MSSDSQGIGLSKSAWFLLVGLALVWRGLLWPDFYGWEESDYGNLAMARGVLDSNFTTFDMNHLPLYYALSAFVLLFIDSAEIATVVVSLAGGLDAFVLAVRISEHLFGRIAAVTAGVCLLAQPEFSLYSVSALREPLYAALLLASTYALIRERLRASSSFAGLAFLVRFDALIVLGLVLLVTANRRGFNGRRTLHALGPLLGCVALWMLYCQFEHGTWQFWAHSVGVNLETGGAANVSGAVSWIGQGMAVTWGLVTTILPQHLSWVLFLAGVSAIPSLLASPHPGVRIFLLTTILLVGFWLAIGFVGQHEVGHNLYWKWLLPLIPYWAIGAGVILARAGERLLRVAGPATTAIAAALLGLAMLAQQARESQRQISVSEELYKPQLDLARSIEADIPEDQVLLVDNIPGCWLNRQPHNRTLWSWMDVPVSGAEFGDWLVEEDVRYVLWFREAWTQAPRVAPNIASGETTTIGPVKLVALDQEDAYGWVWYRVDAPA